MAAKQSKSESLKSSKGIKRFRLPRLSRKPAKTDENTGYFMGAWRELKLVRWPDRKATWGLTVAVIVFSAVFAAIILGLDFAFNELFRKVLL